MDQNEQSAVTQPSPTEPTPIQSPSPQNWYKVTTIRLILLIIVALGAFWVGRNIKGISTLSPIHKLLGTQYRTKPGELYLNDLIHNLNKYVNQQIIVIGYVQAYKDPEKGNIVLKDDLNNSLAIGEYTDTNNYQSIVKYECNDAKNNVDRLCSKLVRVTGRLNLRPNIETVDGASPHYSFTVIKAEEINENAVNNNPKSCNVDTDCMLMEKVVCLDGECPSCHIDVSSDTVDAYNPAYCSPSRKGRLCLGCIGSKSNPNNLKAKCINKICTKGI